MKIFVAQQNYHIGNFEDNKKKLIKGIEMAKAAEADLVIFSELSVCGYPARDFLEFSDFIEKCYQSIEEIATHSHSIGVIIGAPQRNSVKEGKDLYNAAWFLYNGEVQQVVQKTLLPTYDVFDEYRYFEPASAWDIITFKGVRIALTICEDIWNLGNNPLYRICPMDKLMEQQPQLMINISASPFDYNHEEDRKAVVRQNVLKYGIPMVYCNAVGAQTEIVFDGGSLVYDAEGNLIKELNFFEEDYYLADVLENGVAKSTHTIEQNIPERTHPLPEAIIPFLTNENNIAQIYQALLLGIKDYFSKMGFKKAIIGSSGGIDSAVTLAIACEALGKENVFAMLMPSPFSSEHSVSDAVELSQNLGNAFEIIPIHNIYQATLTALQPIFKTLPFGLAEENMQSRTRGNLLMSVANKMGYILLNTSNKSELATGYGTLYGDMAGGLSVLGDVYKMQVFALANYINRNKAIIPTAIITKPPSAELRPDQKDSDSLPDYAVLDTVLFQYIEQRKGYKEIVASGGDESLVKRVLHLVNTNEYKRNQFCPIIRVSAKAFGVGRRLPIVAVYNN
jgi:NAD+ synthase (glutamine-hydrolysing)